MNPSNSTNQILVDGVYTFRNEVLNKVSPSFCTAKWLQSTVYLWNGYTHSCHHPSSHKVAPEAVIKNPKALHNTPVKFFAREEMLKGIQTKECQYCWNIENGAGDHLSDRTYKSTSPWARPHLDAVVASGPGTDINPTYMEVAFESTCNLKCTYCTEDVSSKWMEEIDRHGPYQMSEGTAHSVDWLKSTGRFPIRHDEYNPYVEAFWKWWPELVGTLEVFRITGGEPLLSKHTWRILDELLANPRPELELAINTNLCVPRKLIDRLADYCNRLKGKIKSLDIYTSLEATGAQAEYIRYGMVYSEFTENCRHILRTTDIRLHFMVATNLLSVTTFHEFLDFVYTLRTEFNEDDGHNRIPMMISYVRWPHYLDLRHLPQNIKDKYGNLWQSFVESKTRITSPNKAGRFYLEEIDQVKRLVGFMQMLGEDALKNKKDFALYHDQYDARRHVDFAETFPELMPFYHECKKQL